MLRSTTIVWPQQYRWPPQASWVEPIRLGFEPLAEIRQAQLFADVPGVVPFLMEIGSRRFAVAIDYGDDTALHPSLLESYDLVFKMQYLSDGYGSDSVVPGGFVPNGLSLYRYLPHLRAARDRGKRTTDAYGRFGREKTAQARNDAVMLLRRQSAFRYKGGFGRVRYGESLFEAARARVSVDLPGRGPLCFRLIDYLAIGAAVVARPHMCRLPVELEDDRHLVYCGSDLTDLVDVIDHLVRDPARLARLGAEARTYFDRYLDYRQLARYYMTTCFERL